MNGRLVDYPDPVVIPQFDMVEFRGGDRYPVLKIPMGTDRKGNPTDFVIGAKLARAIMNHIKDIELFIDILDG
jgi:hypothetical protein